MILKYETMKSLNDTFPMASVKPDSIQGQMLQAREMEKQEADELAIRTLGLAQHEALRMRKVPCLDRQNNLILLVTARRPLIECQSL